ncbi:sodium:proton antiporter [Aphanothece hegewaldii CCALA 016]|uniref:Sodium:proton antiporter n=1 Tax=Aphanothece hegewaldii CCALA 016 TaxID=2107694 RepID=A0A2T1LZR1_9CHRO|nr:sodium:proton antiporter [Aphanothece hegewaldii]PSF37893.1 sodium:proton antiporter [Aphanothece hegewaldii CCALA 016]
MSFLTSTTDAVIEKDLKQFLVILMIALGAASLPKIFVSLRQVPYTLLLVIVGLGLALLDVRLLHLSPGLILMVFLPPLLFEAGWNMRWSELKKEALPCGLYAIGGVLITIAGVGWALHELMDVPWMSALLVGGCLAATDSAAVLALFGELGAKKRLRTFLEGESLFNDGASVVAYGVLVELALDPKPFNLSETMLRFVLVSGIGLAVGGVIGICVTFITQRYELSWVEQSLSVVTAYGAYLLAEELGGSGVIGVVSASLIIGNLSHQPIQNKTQKRATMLEFWEFIVFFVNSILFLLLGDQIQIYKFFENLDTTLVAFFAVIVSRGISIYGFSALTNWLAKTEITWQEQTALLWTGLRGSVSIALALSLPILIIKRDEIIANSFGVVWLTLLVQGLTTKWLLDKLDLVEDRSLYQQYSELIARRDALQKILSYILGNQEKLLISPQLYESQLNFVQQQLEQLEKDIDYLREQHPQLQAFTLQQYQEKLLSIEAETYTNFVRSGLLENSLPPLMQKAFDS